MESFEIEEIPTCSSEEACELIATFLNMESKDIIEEEIGRKLYKKRESDKLLLLDLKSQLYTLRKECDKIVVEIYKLTNSINFIKED